MKTLLVLLLAMAVTGCPRNPHPRHRPTPIFRPDGSVGPPPAAVEPDGK
ncbi:MAG: hypothetical protein U1G07_01920 [Verrucomicrobiota bacterium]